MTPKDHRQHWVAIAADPEERAHWLIYADRLEEEGAADVALAMRASDIRSVAFDFADGSIAFDLAGNDGPAIDSRLRIGRDGLPTLEQRSVGRDDEARWAVRLPAAESSHPPGSITPARLLRDLIPRRRRLP